MKSFKNIIIRTPNWLGDLMMSTAFIRTLMEAFPDSRIDLIVKSGFESIPLPHRGKIIPFDKSKQSAKIFGKTLQNQGYDLSFVLPPSLSSAMMMWASKIKIRVGHKGSFRNFFLHPAVTYKKKYQSRHLTEEFHELLEQLVEEKIDISPPGLNLTEKWIETILVNKKRALPVNYILFAPGAIYGPAKQWPVDHFAALAQLCKKSGINVIVMGTAKDHHAGEEICRNNSNCLNLCGETSLNEVIALMARSSLLISNDSGAMHVMAALQKPQISIFGSTSTVWTGPLNSKAQVVKIPIGCSPCFSRTCKFDHYECLRKIVPELVFEYIKKLDL